MPQSLRFAHFEVLTRSDGSPHVLGQGAMGMTYKALDQNLLSLAVIKVPSIELLAHASARQRFLQEAQMMARLRHPHVASVFFYGDSASGAFYAMEFCDGPSLQDYVEHHGPIEPHDTFRMAVQISSALQALDSHELIHRDLKPSNIIITADSTGSAHLKLIDFGVAREGLPADNGGLTMGGFVGTPAYASPEQLLESTHLDSRSDMYSLGAVMWFCLTGSPPFEGSQFEIMFHHVNTEPDWSQLPEMSPEYLALLKRLLAKSAEERYASPAVLTQTLQGLLGVATSSGTMHLRTASKDRESKNVGGFDPIKEISADGFGKVWQAKDILTGRVVSLRILPPEFAAKQGLTLRIQRLAAVVRVLEHARWQRVWHFEQSGSDCRLAMELIEGPTVLNLLKARQYLPLPDILPLLSQVAEAMDFAASQGLTAMETAPERLPVWVDGWKSMSEPEHATLLRKPLSEWPEWSVKVCPLRLSQSAQDYVLPTDSMAAQAITRLGTDFVQLCYSLLTGQGRSADGYVPSPALSPESNDFFERHFTRQNAVTQTCGSLLRLLCVAEGIPAPAAIMDDGGDPFATRIVSGPSTKTAAASHTRPSTRTTAAAADTGVRRTSADPDATVINTNHVNAMMASDTFMAAVGAPVSARMKELEQRRAELDAEADRLKEDERLEAERDWLAREKAVLEKAKDDVAKKERERAEKLAEEQVRLAEQKKALEQQQALLEEKKREQQRLEQEIQLRAQLDFQKLQEEAKARESDLQKQRAAVEEALRAREKEFELREKESLEKLAAIKQEAADLEEEVQQEYLTVRHIEVQQNRRQQDEEAVKELAKENLAAEERKLEQIRTDLEARSKQWERAQKGRTLILILGSLAAVMLAAGAAYFIKGRIELKAIDLREFPGEQQWKASLTERDSAKSEQRWDDLLNWCTATDEALRANPEFSETLRKHQQELSADASAAITGLLAQASLPDTATDSGRKTLLNLEKMKDWVLPNDYRLLLTKLRMPEAAERGEALEALRLYQDATNVQQDFAPKLEKEMDATLATLRAGVSENKVTASEDLLLLLDQLRQRAPAGQAESIALFTYELHANQLLREGKQEQALATLLEAVKHNPNRVEPLRNLASTTINHLTKLDLPNIFPFMSSLKAAAEIWHLLEAYITLAKLEPDHEGQYHNYKLAEQYGSEKARAFVGRVMINTGIDQNKPALIEEGLTKLKQAASDGDTDGMVLLGEVLYAGRGVEENAPEAYKLAQQAQAKSHPDADYLAGKALLRMAELDGDAENYNQAAELLKKAVEENRPSAAYFLYLANYNAVVKKPARAVEALEKGALAHDPNCLYTLGLWHTLGQPPVKLNLQRARQLIQQAADSGHGKAKEWLQMHPPS